MAGKPFRTVDLVYCAVGAALIALCSWVSVPATVEFTLQTFAIFLLLALLGGRRGALSVCVYLLLGAAGLPVFAGFNGGVGALLGPTGGYLAGFVPLTLCYWLVTAKLGGGTRVQALGMILGLIVCYAFGTAWFMRVYARASGPVGLATALGWCVFPFIPWDGAKLAAALLAAKALSRRMKLR